MAVKLTQGVFDDIEAVRQSGATNMLDRRRVQDILEDMGADEAAEWVRQNKKTYGRLIFEGPEIADECDTD